MADLSSTAASVGLICDSGSERKVQVGEAVTQGQPLYLNATDGKHYQCDADDTAAKAEAVGIALTPAGADGYTVMARYESTLNLGATLVVGETYVLSGTKGGICPIGDLATGDWVTHLGIAITTAHLKMGIKISGVQVPA